MRNYVFVIVFVLGMISGCSGRRGDIPVVRKTLSAGVVIADSLYLSFPGQLRVTSAHILLNTPFDSDGFLKIYDRQTGRELGWTGKVGNGPGEWITPSFGNVAGDRIAVYDANVKKYVLAGVERLYGEVSEAGAMKKIDVSPTGFVFLNERLAVAADFSETPFKLISDGRIFPCGQYPFKEPVSNTFDCYQGLLAVHPKKRVMAYGMLGNPYLSLYRVKPDGVELIWENQFKEPDYSISGGKLHWGNGHSTGVSDVTFTKDYIACLTPDAKNEENMFGTFVRGREMKVPLMSVYLFDIEGNLRYILDPPFHIIRLASDTDSNTLYAVSIEPDYRIVRFDPDWD
ncbi:MAG: hypothetical protein LBC47_04630 [Tannerella sp.]|jgi:hypothetical protein|nr:hypothetical protein [Tannerella sp.]